jgi:hypothetical protein
VHITIVTRAAACVIAFTLFAATVAGANAQEPEPSPMPTPAFDGDFTGFGDSFEDLSAIAEVGALEPPPEEVSEPPAAEVEQPAPVEAAPAPVTTGGDIEPATALPSGLPSTGSSSAATATNVLQLSVVVLLAGAACVALSRKLRRA